MQMISSAESAAGKRAMTKLMGRKCLEDVDGLFDILNGRVATCPYLEILT